jgi:hypothetical protein
MASALGPGFESCRAHATHAGLHIPAFDLPRAHGRRSRLRWAQRGLALYGDDAARPEAVEDLNKRAAAYSAKLAGAVAGAPRQPIVADRVTVPKAITETLTCEGCGADWDRAVTRGRKPRLCPACRA